LARGEATDIAALFRGRGGERDVGDDRPVVGAERGPPRIPIFAKLREANTLPMATSGRNGTLPCRIGQVKWSVL
jgi:hypothetical protein